MICLSFTFVDLLRSRVRERNGRDNDALGDNCGGEVGRNKE